MSFLQKTASIDKQIADFLVSLSPDAREFHSLFRYLSSRVREGHLCLKLSDLDKFEEEDIRLSPDAQRRLQELPIVSTDTSAPLVLSEDRLYFQKLHDCEQTIVAGIRSLMLTENPVRDANLLRESILTSFGLSGDKKNAAQKDGQALAAFTCALHRFAVITGGPGTGKTTTIGKILKILREQRPSVRIAVAAPTGKAALRLKEGIAANQDLPPDFAAEVAGSTVTAHRLLGRMGRTYRHNSQNPLPYDIVILDEASMIDTPMMARILQALGPQTSLILSGDHEQLASVEAGSFFGDICRAAFAGNQEEALDHFRDFFYPAKKKKQASSLFNHANLSSRVIRLRKNYRFEESPEIAGLAEAIAAGEDVADLIAKGQSSVRMVLHDRIAETLEIALLDCYGILRDSEDPSELLDRAGNFRILCAHRKGPFGSERINDFASSLLEKHGLVRAVPGTNLTDAEPRIILENDYTLELFNGDTGFLLQKNAASAVYFRSGSKLKSYPPGRLPENERAYAMTVHKSQGSEFDHVMLVLPEEDSPLLTRELIYTALTRARKTFTVFSNEKILNDAVKKTIRRSSGIEAAFRA